MAAPLDDVHVLIKEAKDLRQQFTARLNTLSPWCIVAEPTHTPGLYRHMFRVQPINDAQLRIKAKQLFDALRTALDYLNVACVRLNGKKDTKDHHFPFAGTEASFLKSLDKKCAGVPNAIRDYFVLLKPYPGGNDQLYELNSLRNQQAHVQLSNLIGTVAAIQVHAMDSHGVVAMIEIPEDSTEAEIMVSPETTIKYGVSLLSRLNFEGTSVISAYGLDALIAQVESIVTHTEAILQNLGLLADPNPQA